MYLHEFWTSCTEGTRGANFHNSLSCQTDKICRLDENSRMQEIIAFYEHTSCLPILRIFIYLFIYLLPFFLFTKFKTFPNWPPIRCPGPNFDADIYNTKYHEDNDTSAIYHGPLQSTDLQINAAR